MKINIGIFLFLLVGNALALTERVFIDKVLKQDSNFEKDQIYVTIKQIELDASRQNYEGWNTGLAASISNSYYDIDKDTTSKNIYTQHRFKDDRSIGLVTTKRFLSNPSSLTFIAGRSTPDTDITRYKQDKIYTGDNAKYNISTFNNVYAMRYKYPLLKQDANAKSLKTYRRNILRWEREKLDFNDAQEKFLVSRLKQYIDWNFYQKNAEIYLNYRQLLKLMTVNKGEDNSELNTAILRSHQDVSSNDSKLQSLKRVLIVALSDPSLQFESPEIDTNKHLKIKPNLTQYVRQNVRALLKLDIDKRLKKTDLKYHKNQFLPQLDFSVSAEKNDKKGNTVKDEYDNKSMLYTVGFDFSIPIGTNVNGQKNIKVAQLNLRKLGIDYDNKLKTILSNTEALIVKLRLAKKSLNSYQKLLTNVHNEAVLARKSYRGKVISIKKLIDAFKEQRDVDLDYIKTLTDYQKSLLSYNDKLDNVLPTIIPQ